MTKIGPCTKSTMLVYEEFLKTLVTEVLSDGTELTEGTVRTERFVYHSVYIVRGCYEITQLLVKDQNSGLMFFQDEEGVSLIDLLIQAERHFA